MVEITVDYEGDLHCRAVHGPSGDVMATDAPVDNHGRGEAFSPTDLVGTALGTCMLTVMGIAAQKKGVELKGATARVQKEMSKEPPRRVAHLVVEIVVPLPEDHAERAFLEGAANGCPVHHSLHPDVVVDTTYRWTG